MLVTLSCSAHADPLSASTVCSHAPQTEHHSDAVRALLDPEGSHASQPVSRWALSPPPRSRAEVWGTRDSVRGLLDPDKQAETGAPSVEVRGRERGGHETVTPS